MDTPRIATILWFISTVLKKLIFTTLPCFCCFYEGENFRGLHSAFFADITFPVSLEVKEARNSNPYNKDAQVPTLSLEGSRDLGCLYSSQVRP